MNRRGFFFGIVGSVLSIFGVSKAYSRKSDSFKGCWKADYYEVVRSLIPEPDIGYVRLRSHSEFFEDEKGRECAKVSLVDMEATLVSQRNEKTRTYKDMESFVRKWRHPKTIVINSYGGVFRMYPTSFNCYMNAQGYLEIHWECIIKQVYVGDSWEWIKWAS